VERHSRAGPTKGRQGAAEQHYEQHYEQQSCQEQNLLWALTVAVEIVAVQEADTLHEQDPPEACAK